MWQPNGPFTGSEALDRGLLNRHQLRTHFRPVFPDVYLSRHVTPSLRDRTIAAYLWSGRQGVVVGLAAASMHGSRWIANDVPIELIHVNVKPPKGLITRRETLLQGERQMMNGLAVSSPARTAFDLGRRGEIGAAVARLDALAHATCVQSEAIGAVARRHPRVRGLRQLEHALNLMDAGAQSPKETWLRLLLVRAGLPRPETQIPVVRQNGEPFASLDMGWRSHLVAVEYDGGQHQTERRQYVRDIRRRERLEQLGWLVITVIAEDRAADIVDRVRRALATRKSSVTPGR